VLLPPAAFSTAIALRSSDPVVLRGAVFVVLLVVLAVVVVFSRSTRQAYRLLAAERAELASGYAALAAERLLEHTAMLEQFAALLRDQADEIESLRGRASSEADLPGVAVLFGAKTDDDSTSDGALVAVAKSRRGHDETDEMWPDLAEAPTVVDLMAWDAAAFRRADLRREA
jgi:hypothetical protein